jgi:6-phosphogluconolactonase/glucosamine-6-phosphate isomerase/deaminase
MEVIKTTPDNVVNEAAKQVVDCINATQKPVLLLCPGGSAVAVANVISGQVSFDQVTVAILDERFNTTEDEINSHKIFPLFKLFPTISPLTDENKSLEETAHAYEQKLRGWFTSHPHGCCVALAGIGPDGHIAGIHIQESAEQFAKLFESEKWIVGYEAPHAQGSPFRITATCTFFRKGITDVIVYMAGQNKKEALDAVNAETGDLHKTPARIVRELPKVTIVTDIA